MKVNITQEHINGGMARDGDRCAAALAITDAFEGKHVYVDTMNVIVHRPGDVPLVCKTPPNLSDFVWKVDEGKEVEPIEVELDFVPAEHLNAPWLDRELCEY